jgi:hypothetical protein
MIDAINWTTPTSVLSHYRVEQYLIAKSSSDIVRFGDDISPGKFPEDITDYTYVVYTIGIAKSFWQPIAQLRSHLENLKPNISI